MGLETRCTLRVGQARFEGAAHLDSAALTFRGGTKLAIPLGTVTAADADKDGALRVAHAGGVCSLLLGDRAVAENWARKILHPKSLVDKLGLKPESRVAVLGVDDAEFRAQSAARLRAAPLEKLPAAGAALDFIFHAADGEAELAKLAALKKHLVPAGAIWVVSPKGKAARVKDTDVMRAAKTAGLVVTKVCGFSATHTALKLVIPAASRS
jgi:Protein of unknown function (DUF3052)